VAGADADRSAGFAALAAGCSVRGELGSAGVALAVAISSSVWDGGAVVCGVVVGVTGAADCVAAVVVAARLAAALDPAVALAGSGVVATAGAVVVA
jgi:hypothetical protein